MWGSQGPHPILIGGYHGNVYVVLEVTQLYSHIAATSSFMCTQIHTLFLPQYSLLYLFTFTCSLTILFCALTFLPFLVISWHQSSSVHIWFYTGGMYLCVHAAFYCIRKSRQTSLLLHMWKKSCLWMFIDKLVILLPGQPPLDLLLFAPIITKCTCWNNTAKKWQFSQKTANLECLAGIFKIIHSGFRGVAACKSGSVKLFVYHSSIDTILSMIRVCWKES